MFFSHALSENYLLVAAEAGCLEYLTIARLNLLKINNNNVFLIQLICTTMFLSILFQAHFDQPYRRSIKCNGTPTLVVSS